MAAATKDRNTKMIHLDYVLPLKIEAGETILGGIMVNTDADGFATAATDTAAHRCRGVSKRKYENTAGADGDELAEVDVGIFAFATGGANPVLQTDEGELCYVLDNQTVSLAAGTTNSVIAGKVVRYVSSSEVWVDFRQQAIS